MKYGIECMNDDLRAWFPVAIIIYLIYIFIFYIYSFLLLGKTNDCLIGALVGLKKKDWVLSFFNQHDHPNGYINSKFYLFVNSF